MADNYKSNMDRQIMGLKAEKSVKSVNLLDQLEQNDTKLSKINFNIIPFPLDRLSKQLSDLYLYVIDLKKELRSAVINNPTARKHLKAINEIDNGLDKINNVIINEIVSKLNNL